MAIGVLGSLIVGVGRPRCTFLKVLLMGSAMGCLLLGCSPGERQIREWPESIYCDVDRRGENFSPGHLHSSLLVRWKDGGPNIWSGGHAMVDSEIVTADGLKATLYPVILAVPAADFPPANGGNSTRRVTIENMDFVVQEISDSGGNLFLIESGFHSRGSQDRIKSVILYSRQVGIISISEVIDGGMHEGVYSRVLCGRYSADKTPQWEAGDDTLD